MLRGQKELIFKTMCSYFILIHDNLKITAIFVNEVTLKFTKNELNQLQSMIYMAYLCVNASNQTTCIISIHDISALFLTAKTLQ